MRALATSANDSKHQGGAVEGYLKARIRDDIGQFLFKKIERRPMILPVVIEV
ncbi:MAG: hypothetical protein ABIG71_01635 [Candidatus Uhrbacteria bacterium]